ncbi:MAG TPA: hypothetical protein DHW82_10215 [Spirochaetia bacterium]|nr:hypothetical protein [Spirochaetia bacterium]
MTIQPLNSKQYQYQNETDQLNGLSRKTQATKDQNKLKDVCSEFEAVFLDQVFKEMRKSVKMGNKSPLIDGGMGEDIFKDMLYSEYTKVSAKNNSIGIRDMIYNFITEKRG